MTASVSKYSTWRFIYFSGCGFPTSQVLKRNKSKKHMIERSRTNHDVCVRVNMLMDLTHRRKLVWCRFSRQCFEVLRVPVDLWWICNSLVNGKVQSCLEPFKSDAESNRKPVWSGGGLIWEHKSVFVRQFKLWGSSWFNKRPIMTCLCSKTFRGWRNYGSCLSEMDES